MPTSNDNWAQRFLIALDVNSERKGAFKRLLDAGVKEELLLKILQEMFSADFVEQKQAKMRAAVADGRKLQKIGCRSASAKQVKKVEQAFRAALGPGADILFDCALPWPRRLDHSLDAALKAYQKHSSKKMLGSLKSRDCCLALLTTYLEMQTGSPHYEDVAQMMQAAATASSSTNIPLELDSHWVAVTAARFKNKFNNHFARVIQPLAAKYIHTTRHQL